MDRSHQDLVSDIRLQVCMYLAEYFIVDIPMKDHLLLVDELGADSLDLLQVVYMLNEIFLIEIDVDLLPRMLTVGGVCDVVVQLHLGKKSCDTSQ
jgi:acyl carrier protein